MTQSVAVSARSLLIAGMSAAVVGAATVTPVTVAGVSEGKITAIATQLAAATSPIETAIKNTYNAVEPWAAWGAALGQWALGFVPGLWWVAPGISLAYYTAEPLVQAGVYTVADVLGQDFAQIGPDVTAGINQSVSNAATYGLAWLNSLVPLPPLPPFPPRPGAAVAAPPALAAAATTVVAGTSAKSVTTPIEVAIKNSYNAVEPWVRYGMSWASYVLGLIPVVSGLGPIVPLTYYTVEPLVRAGTYALADLIGFNFAAIGPDLVNGVTTSSRNFINGILNWANIPLPPPLPGAAVAAPAASARAAAAVAAPAEIAPAAPTTGNAPQTDPDPAVTQSAPTAPVSPVDDATPAAGGASAAAQPSPVVELPSAVAGLPAADTGAEDDARPSRTAHRGSSASAGDSGDAGAPAKPDRHARG